MPQHYLRNFTDADGFLYRYRLLVPSSKARKWQKLKPESVAFRYDLYTFSGSGQDDDDLERWFCNDFECHAAKVIEKVIKEQQLKPADWHTLADFFALQFVRTPAFLHRHLKQCQEQEAQELERTKEDFQQYMNDQELFKKRFSNRDISSRADEFRDYPVRVVKKLVDADTVAIRVESVVGRATWRHAMRYVLRNTLKALHNHRWTVLHAPSSKLWFATDDPVIALNFNSMSDYSFGGGWKSKGSELLLPLSQKHLLYTRVNSPVPTRGFEVDMFNAQRLRILMATHASREIYASHEDAEIEKLRERWVNQQTFTRELEEWAKWPKEHGDAERHIFSKEE